MSLNGSAQSIGSPSRMRGKEGDELGLGQTIRITPACAGKRAGPNNSLTGNQDHPRVCGEKAITVSSAHIMRGSPPRVRGKVVGSEELPGVVGITPACAGKRTRPRRWVQPPRDHPRVCGEKQYDFLTSTCTKGSPPRMRGKAPINRHQAEEHGITLAYAGKSCPPQAPTFTRQDHPRVCGEKCPPGKFFFMTVGSPPRVRGKALPAHACPAA